ncbi:MAG: sulfite oxidase-like oxidoreductase [Chloroflexi bacterium]|uniref:Sulfite oxidase-like oxidoreductase n=1 Tax=Candidatus Chlorohelix allophototropha TaxID=3003348 RepID=A0A8T7M993_9CHLR|nr:sulfite oxidase-like oxidoreductase [Chloroflexota bacterium]WJW68526.1 sulfite oxidase-like oxidoreductase [Chloroflexota bacterium L227-S17]
MAFQFFKKPDPDMSKRVPPGQSLTDRFPVLHYGPVPFTDLAKWDFKIFGTVEEPVRFNWDELMALPQSEITTDIHCVTRWSKLDTVWTGVLVKDLMKNVKLKPESHFVLAHAEHGFTANIPLEVFLDDDVMLAHSFDRKPLARDHGYPLRLLVPKKYFWKSAKWLRGLEFMSEDKPGFWERNGYSNSADPWKEERYNDDNW